MYGLRDLAEAEGYDDPWDLIEDNHIDSVVPAICTECGYTTGMEPDQSRGWCEDCGNNTVVSCLILAEVI
jgi:hypothetical protein